MFLRGPFNNVPRLPLQLADCLVRLGWFLLRLPRDLRSGKRGIAA